jgi:hypothetical protein
MSLEISGWRGCLKRRMRNVVGEVVGSTATPRHSSAFPAASGLSGFRRIEMFIIVELLK